MSQNGYLSVAMSHLAYAHYIPNGLSARFATR